MKDATKRSILRWIHIVFSIPILGYIYSPFEEIPKYAPAVRFVFLPVIVLSGLWMWKAMSFDDLLRRDRPKKRCSEPLPAWPFLSKVSAPGWRQCLFHWHRPNKSFKPTR